MVCLDTTFLVDIMRGNNEALKAEEEFSKKGEVLTIASPSLIELFKGLELKSSSKNIKENEKTKIYEIISSFPILSLDLRCAIKAGEIEADLINNGEIIDLEDIMIGAIALCNKEKLITRNIKHFQKIKGLHTESY